MVYVRLVFLANVEQLEDGISAEAAHMEEHHSASLERRINDAVCSITRPQSHP